MLAPGTTFGRYRVESEVGRGAAGIVYRAIDGERVVALKVLTLSDEDPDRAPRFLREGKLAASISHPDIVSVLDVGEVDGNAYLAFEWVEGRTLIEVIREGTLSTDDRIALLVQIAETVAHAHEMNIVHRDLKPANVMLAASSRAKLLDFGIAKRTVAPVDTFVTREDVIVGTLTYMAPEQMSSADVDGRADQFAWGVIAYELLSGVHPRTTIERGQAPFPFGTPRPLTNVPDRVADVVARAMHRHKDKRFASMRDLLRALQTDAHPPGPPPSGRGEKFVVKRDRFPIRIFLYSAAIAIVIGLIGAAAFMAFMR